MPWVPDTPAATPAPAPTTPAPEGGKWVPDAAPAAAAAPAAPAAPAPAKPPKKGWGVWGLEQGVGLAGWAGGKALGGAAGLLSPVPGGAYAGQLIGGAAGMTAGDEFTQWLDHHLYGTPVDYSTK